MRLRKIKIITFACICVTLLFLLVYFKYTKVNNEDYPTVTVSRTDIQDIVSAVGVLTPIDQVTVGAQVSGQLKSVRVKLGDYVKRGELLATIDPVIQRNNLYNAEAQLRYIEAQRESQQSQLKLLQINFKREMLLRRSDANSIEDLDTARSQVEVAKSNIKATDAQHVQALIAVETAKANLNYTNIYSPLDGYVTDIVSKEGQTIVSSQNAPSVMVISDLDHMYIKAKISEADIIRIKKGQNASFNILGLNNTSFSTFIQSIEPSPPLKSSFEILPQSQNDAVYYSAILPVDNENHLLRPMMTALVNIILNEKKNVLAIPDSSIYRLTPNGPAFVFVLNNKKPEVRNVTVGLSNSVVTEITDGLIANEKILTNPEYYFKGIRNE